MIILAWLTSCALSAGMALGAGRQQARGRTVSFDYKVAMIAAAVIAAALTAVVLTAFIELDHQL